MTKLDRWIDQQNTVEIPKKVDLSAFVDLTSNQSVGGVKTFTSIPLLPSSMPTLNNQAANKAYVDSVAGAIDHGALTGLEDNDHPQYLLTTGKAADSDKLDGLDSTAFLQTHSWTSWTPTLTGWSSTTTLTCRYLKIGKILFFSAVIAGTSNDYSSSFTLPETAILTEYTGTMGYCVNNGSALTAAGRYAISQGSNICRAYTDMAAGAWTASGTKRVSVYGWIATN